MASNLINSNGPRQSKFDLQRDAKGDIPICLVSRRDFVEAGGALCRMRLLVRMHLSGFPEIKKGLHRMELEHSTGFDTHAHISTGWFRELSQASCGMLPQVVAASALRSSNQATHMPKPAKHMHNSENSVIFLLGGS